MRLSEIVSLVFALFIFVFGCAVLFFSPPIGLVFGSLCIWIGISGLREVSSASQFSSERHLHITNSGFASGSDFYDFADVRHLSFTNVITKKVTNFMASGEDQTVTIEITVPGKILKFVAGPTTSTWSVGSFGQKPSQSLIEKYRVIAERSFDSRLQRYLQSLDSNGYLIYDSTRILRNGDVQHKAGTFNLKASSSQLRRGPFTLYLQPVNGGWVKRVPTLSTMVDADVFYFLLDKVFEVRWAASSAGDR